MSLQKKNIVFIINPISGVGRQKTAEDAIRKHLDHSKFSYEIITTKYAHHATEIARNAAIAKIDIVVAMGGDGSANDVAQGLLNSETVMGIIPVGSGNGLARHLKIPISLEKSIQIINSENFTKIDTATINEKLFISIAGLGFDAYVAEEFAKCKRRGFRSYSKTVFTKFIGYQPSHFKINFDGREIQRTAIVVSFANSDQFGYNASIAPKASINDGFIDLVIVSPVSFFRGILLLGKLFFKTIESSSKVEIYKAKEIKVEVSNNVSCHIDGDPNDQQHSVHVKVHPKSLNIFIP